jgi:ABC-type sugar transport system permease subunit
LPLLSQRARVRTRSRPFSNAEFDEGAQGLLAIVPFAHSLHCSFINRSLLFPDSKLVGLDNYLRLLTDPTFFCDFGFTAVLTVATFVREYVVGPAIALLLDGVGRFFLATRIIFSIPIAPNNVIIIYS